MAHAGDITELSGRELAPADIITFGSPCQGLSIAGQRLGLADGRSGLFSEAVRIIREMQEVTNGRYPQIAVWENVPGALSSAGGRDFKAVLEAFTESEIPMPCSGRWAKAGMVRSGRTDLAWCVYDAQYFGTAQRRRRLFLVADFRGTCAGEILFIPKSLHGYFAEDGTPRQGVTAHAQDGVGGTGKYTIIMRNEVHDVLPVITTAEEIMPAVTMRIRQGCDGGGKGALLQIEKSGTLATGNDQYLFEPPHIRSRSACGSARLPKQGYLARRLTPTECERLQGYPDGWTAHGHKNQPISDRKRYLMLGNSVAVPCVAYIMQGISEVLQRRCS